MQYQPPGLMESELPMSKKETIDLEDLIKQTEDRITSEYLEGTIIGQSRKEGVRIVKGTLKLYIAKRNTTEANNEQTDEEESE